MRRSKMTHGSNYVFIYANISFYSFIKDAYVTELAAVYEAKFLMI